MRFSDVIGQQGVADRLLGMVEQNRLSHALLLLGREGTGALPLALALSQYLLCEKVSRRTGAPQPAPPDLFGMPPVEKDVAEGPSDACGNCPSCTKASGLVHPDIHYSYPTIRRVPDKPSISTDFVQQWREFVGKHPYGNEFDWLQSIGAENKQGKITAAECNDINRKLNLKSQEGGYKILVMWLPEQLEEEGNKLLKLIEEPPDDTLILLVSHDESQVLPTILSRVQTVRVPPIGTEAMVEALQARAGLDVERAMSVATLSGGDFREALSLALQEGDDWLSVTREWMNAILKGGPSDLVRWVDAHGKLGREQLKQLLDYFTHLVGTGMRLKCMGDALPPVPEGERSFAERLNRLTGLSQQEAIVGELERAAFHIERNVNGRIVLMSLSIKILHIIRDNSLTLVS